jgi:YidC/Oxa1 family membrane protein insertase
MPIWFALYRMLMAVAELYQAPFIPGWIDDMTQPDPYHVLPIALTAMMFVQSKLTPVTQSGLQQKLIQYGMPLMFGVFSFFFPAGLTLYIFTNVCLTAAHHLVIHREGRAEAKAAKVSKANKMAGAADDEVIERAKSKKSTANDDDDDEGGVDDEGDAEASDGSADDGARRKRSRGSRGKGKRKRKRKR